MQEIARPERQDPNKNIRIKSGKELFRLGFAQLAGFSDWADYVNKMPQPPQKPPKDMPIYIQRLIYYDLRPFEIAPGHFSIEKVCQQLPKIRMNFMVNVDELINQKLMASRKKVGYFWCQGSVCKERADFNRFARMDFLQMKGALEKQEVFLDAMDGFFLWLYHDNWIRHPIDMLSSFGHKHDEFLRIVIPDYSQQKHSESDDVPPSCFVEKKFSPGSLYPFVRWAGDF